MLLVACCAALSSFPLSAFAEPTVVSFTAVGTTSWTAPDGVTSVNYLVVAGGGGGGYGNGGGGGGGGVRTGTLSVTPGQSYTVTVGAGGSGGTTAPAAATNGSNSVFGSITSTGGGAGGSPNLSGSCGSNGGSNGGSGGGGSRNVSGCGGSGTAGQGNNGGAGVDGAPERGGGGGGAGAAGTSGTDSGNGGIGIASSITGVSTYYGGGGGGGARLNYPTPGTGGAGGGGNGSVSTAGSPGTANTGGGGGAGGQNASSGSGGYQSGGGGGSGIVVLSYTPPLAGCAENETCITNNSSVTGNMSVVGAIAKGSGTFVIDHPLDPKNKLLYHSFVESPDVKNIYDGIATLNKRGEAIIGLPNYFLALNKDFRYLGTPIGEPMPNLYLKREVQKRFFGLFGKPVIKISGGAPYGRVSWQVTGIRKDPLIVAHPIIPEVEKGPGQLVDKGEYLYPELYESQ